MENKKIDWKMIIGIFLILVVFAAIAGVFWKTVGEQAKLVEKTEAEEEANVISAVYVQSGDMLKRGYFVEVDTEVVFLANIPEGAVYNQNGTAITGAVLEHGDLVKIYGDGAMTRSLPPQYPGVTKMKRIGRASLEETDRYTKAAEKYFAE